MTAAAPTTSDRDPGLWLGVPRLGNVCGPVLEAVTGASVHLAPTPAGGSELRRLLGRVGLLVDCTAVSQPTHLPTQDHFDAIDGWASATTGPRRVVQVVPTTGPAPQSAAALSAGVATRFSEKLAIVHGPQGLTSNVIGLRVPDGTPLDRFEQLLGDGSAYPALSPVLTYFAEADYVTGQYLTIGRSGAR